MTYKVVRTDRYKYIHWVNRGGLDGVVDELYDLDKDPYEMKNLIASRAHAARPLPDPWRCSDRWLGTRRQSLAMFGPCSRGIRY